MSKGFLLNRFIFKTPEAEAERFDFTAVGAVRQRSRQSNVAIGIQGKWEDWNCWKVPGLWRAAVQGS